MWEKEKKIGIGEKKIGELSEPRGSLGRGKGGGAWRLDLLTSRAGSYQYHTRPENQANDFEKVYLETCL